MRARANIGADSGGGGSGDVVVMHFEDVMRTEITSDPILIDNPSDSEVL